MLGLANCHWFVLKQIDGTFYNLDSLLKSPLPFKDKSDMIQYLKYLQAQGNLNILQVIPLE